MAHNLFGERAAFRNGPAWHGLGHSLDNSDGKATTALEIAQADWPVTTMPLWTIWNGMRMETSQVAIVRPPLDDEDGPVILGYASTDYTPITNREVCEMLDPLTLNWPCETVGALGKGEQFFVTLKADSVDVAGDEVRQFFFIHNAHDGSGALKIMFTPVRVVCQNTCIMGAQQATVMANVIHTKRVHAEARFAIDLVPRIRAVQLAGIASLERFSQIKLSAEQIRRVLEATYPDRPTTAKAALFDQIEAAAKAAGESLPDEQIAALAGAKINTERAREVAAAQRLVALERLHIFNESRKNYAWTAWAVYNAVTETECWKDGGSEQSIGKSILLGPRGQTMQRAYDALVTTTK